MNYFTLFLKKTLRFLLMPLSFVPALLAAGMIFWFSSQPADVSSGTSTMITEKIVHSVNYRLDMEWTPAQQEAYVAELEYYIRKAAHFSEFAVLAITLAIPFYVYRIRGWKLFALTLFICAAYAGLDEFHQSFVSGRSPMARDVLIDTSGSLLGILISHPLCVLGRKTIFHPLSLEKERRLKQEYYRNHPDE